MTTTKPSRSLAAAEAPTSARSNSFERFAHSHFHRCERQAVGVLDVGEIDLRLEYGHRAEQRLSNCLAFASERAAGDPLRLTALRLGLRIDQVREALDLREIDPAVQKRAPGELASLGRTQAGNFGQRPRRRGDHGPPAGHPDLDQILAGEAPGRCEAGDQDPLDRFARRRAPQGGENGAARREFRPGRQRREGLGASRP